MGCALRPTQFAEVRNWCEGKPDKRVWALRNPYAGGVEPDDIDYDFVLKIARPYLGELAGGL